MAIKRFEIEFPIKDLRVGITSDELFGEEGFEEWKWVTTTPDLIATWKLRGEEECMTALKLKIEINAIRVLGNLGW